MQISLDFLNLHPLDLLLVSFQFFRLISFPFCQHRVDQHRHLPGRRRDRLLTAGVEGHPTKEIHQRIRVLHVANRIGHLPERIGQIRFIF